MPPRRSFRTSSKRRGRGGGRLVSALRARVRQLEAAQEAARVVPAPLRGQRQTTPLFRLGCGFDSGGLAQTSCSSWCPAGAPSRPRAGTTRSCGEQQACRGRIRGSGTANDGPQERCPLETSFNSSPVIQLYSIGCRTRPRTDKLEK